MHAMHETRGQNVNCDSYYVIHDSNSCVKNATYEIYDMMLKNAMYENYVIYVNYAQHNYNQNPQ